MRVVCVNGRGHAQPPIACDILFAQHRLEDLQRWRIFRPHERPLQVHPAPAAAVDVLRHPLVAGDRIDLRLDLVVPGGVEAVAAVERQQ